LLVDDPVDEIDQPGVAIDDGCAENSEGSVDMMGVDRIVRVWPEGATERSRPDVRRGIDVERIGFVAHREEEEHIVLLTVLHDEIRYVEGLRLDALVVLAQLDLEASLEA
jgi:hypothetical protein